LKWLFDLLKQRGGEPDFEAVREQLRNPDEGVRRRAVESLRGSEEARAIDLLFGALGDESHNVSSAAAELLAASPTEERITRLIALVTSDDSRRRLPAAKVLHRLGEPRAAEALAEAVCHPSDWKLRREATLALGKIGGAHAVDALILMLEDDTEDEEPRQLAASAFAEIGDPAAIEPLTRILAEIGDREGRGDDPLVHAVDEALALLRAMHPGIKPHKPSGRPLLKRLADPDAAIRQKAAEALGRRRDKAAVEPLIARLTDPAPAVRASAATSLGKIGDRLAVGPIARLAGDLAVADASTTTDLGRSGLLVCDAASAALGVLGGPEAEAALLDALKSESAEVRMPAAGALRACTRSRRILDVLARLLDDVSPAVGMAAIADLSSWKRAAHDTTADYTDADLLAVLERASGHDDYFVRVQALCSLADFWKTETAQRLIRAALEDPHEMVREDAIRFLAENRAMDAVPRILELLRQDPEPSVRAIAAQDIGLYFARAEDMDALIAALDDPDSRVRASAASAVGILYEVHRGPHRGAVPRLLELSQDANGFVSEAAQRALAAFGATTPQ
jgi:HEAT repeat protein